MDVLEWNLNLMTFHSFWWSYPLTQIHSTAQSLWILHSTAQSLWIFKSGQHLNTNSKFHQNICHKLRNISATFQAQFSYISATIQVQVQAQFSYISATIQVQIQLQYIWSSMPPHGTIQAYLDHKYKVLCGTNKRIIPCLQLTLTSQCSFQQYILQPSLIYGQKSGCWKL